MPLTDFEGACGHRRIDVYYKHWRLIPGTIRCECGAILKRVVGRISFRSFAPYWTRNIRKDGKPVLVKDRHHLAALCRENGCRPYDLEPIIDRAHPEELKAEIRLEKKRQVKRRAEIGEQAKQVFGPDAEKMFRPAPSAQPLSGQAMRKAVG